LAAAKCGVGPLTRVLRRPAHYGLKSGKCGIAGSGGRLLLHQWRWGCCCVHVWVVVGGAGSVVVSGGGVVVVGTIDDGVGDGLVVCDGAVVDGRVVAGVLPPLPLARMTRP
jgi:hypothetical protein